MSTNKNEIFYTYQDLKAVGEDEQKRIEFIQSVIVSHKSSSLYKTAVDAQSYYDGENPTISNYERYVFDLMGKAHRDMWTANHKIKSAFFQLVIDQEVSYLLSNGINFSDKNTKNKLGINFDETMMDALRSARIGGVSFGLWNLDHVDIFDITEFAPLWDEETGALMAGIRFWQLDSTKPLMITLYEPDGYTRYAQRNGETTVHQPKRAYKIHTESSEAMGEQIVDGTNYPTFPIVPLKSDKNMRSALCGKQATLDALDLSTSQMVNNTSEGALIYWVLKNYDGNDNIDDLEFLRRVKSMKVVHVDDEGDAVPHTIEAPFDGTQATIDVTLRRLYDDFQCFNSAAVSAGSQTATAIQASYTPLDLKCDKIESQMSVFIKAIMALAGIADDEPKFTRSRIINRQEEIQTLIMADQFFDDEYITKKALTIFGDIDEFEALQQRKIADEASRFEGMTDDNNGEQTEQT